MDELTKKINRTCRTRGIIGRNAVVPRIVAEILKKNPALTVLDYGAGTAAIHTQALREAGYDVTAHDFGSNVTEIHDTDALERSYDVVMASNVLNVQFREERLCETLDELRSVTKAGGMLIANYPPDPRHGGFSEAFLWRLLKARFGTISTIRKRPLVWRCVRTP